MPRCAPVTLYLALLVAATIPEDLQPLRAAAQARTGLQPPGDTPVFRSTAEAIHVDVTVTDHAGNPITNIEASEFEVFEDGVPQEITTFANIQVPSDVRSAGAT